MEAFLHSLAEKIADAPWLAPLIAIVTGFLTSLMPCSLSGIPLIIGYVSGSADEEGTRNTKRALALSLLFALGSTVTFCALGLLASALGELLEHTELIMHIVMALLLVLMALQMFGVINIIPSGSSVLAKSRLRGGFGAFVAGLLAGLFASHCAIPVVVAIMAIAVNASGGGAVYGFILLLIFSIGHAVLSVIAGVSVGFVQKLMASEKYERISRIIRIVLGVIILLIAVYILISAFTGSHEHEHEHEALAFAVQTMIQ
ncbi:MAG: sulfite exporter TauE/SafE family protein [Clostridia bacterium]|nr:sulfite exporter TauE/SafE family protein [Clostridia bacterium]